MRQFNITLAAMIACGLLFTISQSGCSTLTTGTGQSIESQTPVGRSLPTYRVEMSGGFQKSKAYTGTIEGPITVQTALERSGAVEQFRNMEIMVLRVVKENGKGLRMPIRYSARKKSVPPEQDYAVLPGDRIVIKPVTNNALDKVVEALGVR